MIFLMYFNISFSLSVGICFIWYLWHSSLDTQAESTNCVFEMRSAFELRAVRVYCVSHMVCYCCGSHTAHGSLFSCLGSLGSLRCAYPTSVWRKLNANKCAARFTCGLEYVLGEGEGEAEAENQSSPRHAQFAPSTHTHANTHTLTHAHVHSCICLWAGSFFPLSLNLLSPQCFQPLQVLIRCVIMLYVLTHVQQQHKNNKQSTAHASI